MSLLILHLPPHLPQQRNSHHECHVLILEKETPHLEQLQPLDLEALLKACSRILQASKSKEFSLQVKTGFLLILTTQPMSRTRASLKLLFGAVAIGVRYSGKLQEKPVYQRPELVPALETVSNFAGYILDLYNH